MLSDVVNTDLKISCIHTDFNDCPSLGKAFFFPGCNLFCPYCHNTELVYDRYGDGIDKDSITIDQALQEIDDCVQTNLNTGKKFLTHEWIVISGGEPLAHLNEVLYLIKRAKEKGLKVKLFTNGTLYKPLCEVLPYLDAISIDIKEQFGRGKVYEEMQGRNMIYNDTTGSTLERSLQLVLGKKFKGLVYFRTVCVAPFVYEQDIEAIKFRLFVLAKDSDKNFTWTLAKFLRQNELVGDRSCEKQWRMHNTFLDGKDGFHYDSEGLTITYDKNGLSKAYHFPVEMEDSRERSLARLS